MEKSNKINELKKIIIEILKKYKIKKAGIFGSYARGEVNKNSDIDIIAEIPKQINLFDFVIKLELEDALNKKVDLVEYSTIKPLIRKKY